MQGSQGENVLSYGARVPISEQTYSWIVVHICDKLPLQQWFSACLLNRELRVLKGLESVFILAKAYNFLNLGQKPLEFFLAL